MRDASRRAARPARKGGLPNARCIASGFEQLPVELAGFASLVTVHLPWGSLLRAAAGRDANGAAGIARLVAPGGRLRLLLSAADRDATSGGMEDLDPGEVLSTYAALGLAPVACRPASAETSRQLTRPGAAGCCRPDAIVGRGSSSCRRRRPRIVRWSERSAVTAAAT